jgi:arsenate reductase
VLVDVRETPLDDATRDTVSGRVRGCETGEFTRSTTWRGLSVAERELPAPDALLAAHPALMKRPVVETLDGGALPRLGGECEVVAASL